MAFRSIHDTHGEPHNGPKGYYHSYSKAKQVKGDKGEFTAIFDGTPRLVLAKP